MVEVVISVGCCLFMVVGFVWFGIDVLEVNGFVLFVGKWVGLVINYSGFDV